MYNIEYEACRLYLAVFKKDFKKEPNAPNVKSSYDVVVDSCIR
jgi:hypothetical protein